MSDDASDTLMRRSLVASVGFNLIAAVLFAFPSSAPARLAGLPGSVPLLYRALVAFFVVLFAGSYAWLARRPIIDRPLVGLAAVGKAGVFAIVLVLWLVGEVPVRGVVVATGDLALAGVFAWWLLGGGAQRSK